MTYIQEEIKLERAYSDTSGTSSRSFAQVRSAFFGWWDNKHMATWDDYWKYCLWQFAPTSPGTPRSWTSPTRFDTQDDMFTFMEANLPSSGGAYTNDTSFRLLEEVDECDPYPEMLRHRNSLVASLAGQNRWSNKGTQYYGVSSAFNAPLYYTNFTNEVGRRFVEAATSFLPGTNNDDCVWYPRASRTMWNWPMPNSTVMLSYLGSRGAAWDSVGSTWVTPAPVGAYTVGTPFVLYEDKRNKVLAISTDTGATRRLQEINAVTAMVFPCVFSGRYYGFLVKPHGGDCWVTESIDTSQYDVLLKLRYKGSFSHQYLPIQPWPTVSANHEQPMGSHFSPTGTGTYLIRKQKEAVRGNVDSNAIPSKVYLCRRHKATGRRSRWVPLYNIVRRTRNAAFRILPAW